MSPWHYTCRRIERMLCVCLLLLTLCLLLLTSVVAVVVSKGPWGGAFDGWDSRVKGRGEWPSRQRGRSAGTWQDYGGMCISQSKGLKDISIPVSHQRTNITWLILTDITWLVLLHTFTVSIYVRKAELIKTVAVDWTGLLSVRQEIVFYAPSCSPVRLPSSGESLVSLWHKLSISCEVTPPVLWISGDPFCVSEGMTMQRAGDGVSEPGIHL